MRIRESVVGKIIITICIALLAAIAIWALNSCPRANASPPDINFPYCPGGGVATAWGGWCDGRTFPDGTKWHQDAFWAPFVGRIWNPIVCVVANAPAPPPLAGPGGCGGGYLSAPVNTGFGPALY